MAKGVFKEKRFGCQASKGEWSRLGVNGGCERDCMGRSPVDEPLILTRYHSYGLPQVQYMKPLKNGSSFVPKTTTKRA